MISVFLLLWLFSLWSLFLRWFPLFYGSLFTFGNESEQDSLFFSSERKNAGRACGHHQWHMVTKQRLLTSENKRKENLGEAKRKTVSRIRSCFCLDQKFWPFWMQWKTVAIFSPKLAEKMNKDVRSPLWKYTKQDQRKFVRKRYTLY